MAIPDNYIDKITKGNDSRMISPAADMVRVNNDNFDGETLDEVLDDVYTKSEVDTKVAEAGSGAVSVTTNQDGTVDINVGNDTYKINLNHTHENMAKLIVCEESDLPSTLANDTIYAIKGLGNTSIDKLIIQGLEFVGGGGGGSSEPSYDAEIEYLQSTGTQYIDTGVVGSTEFFCEIKAEFTENQEGYDTLLGAYTSSKAMAVALAIRKNTVAGVGQKDAAYVQFGDDAKTSSGLVVSSVSTLGLHIYKSALQSGVISVDVDGTLLSKTYNAGTPSLLSMYLFARNRQDNGVGNFSKAKIYYCRIWSGGVLVRDFIPVRVGQVGYMYDQISGRLFGNSGSGDFTLGNDKQNN